MKYLYVKQTKVEVSDEIFYEYRKLRRHEKYLYEADTTKQLYYYGENNNSITEKSTISDDYEQSELNRIIHKSISALPNDEKDFIYMLFWQCLTLNEISIRLGISRFASYRKRDRILSKLKKAIEKEYN